MFDRLIKRFKEKTFDVKVSFELEEGIEDLIFQCMIPGDLLYNKFVLTRATRFISTYEAAAGIDKLHLALCVIRVGKIVKDGFSKMMSAEEFEAAQSGDHPIKNYIETEGKDGFFTVDFADIIEFKPITTTFSEDKILSMQLSDDFDENDPFNWSYRDREKISECFYEMMNPIPPEFIKVLVDAFNEAYTEAAGVAPIGATIRRTGELAEMAEAERENLALQIAAEEEEKKKQEEQAVAELEAEEKKRIDKLKEEQAQVSKTTNDPKKQLLHSNMTREDAQRKYRESMTE